MSGRTVGRASRRRRDGVAARADQRHRIMVGVVDDLQALAEGFGAGGERWTLTAQPDRGRLRVMVQVIEPDGHRWISGSRGRPLPPDRRMATFVGRSGASAQLVIIRVAADVRAVVATLSDGTREDLRLHGDPALLGARLAVLVHPAELEVQRVALLDQQGNELPDTV